MLRKKQFFLVSMLFSYYNNIVLVLHVSSNIAYGSVMHIPLECDRKLLNPPNIHNLRIFKGYAQISTIIFYYLPNFLSK